MPASDYIPQPDAEFDLWLNNFATKIAANPTSFGLTVANATAITGVTTTWNAAYVLANQPATRTAPTIAAKDDARAAAEELVRPFAMQINANASVTNDQRLQLELTVRKTTPTPVPPPLEAPSLALAASIPGRLNFRYAIAGTTSGKQKPPGVIQVEVRYGAAADVLPNPTACNQVVNWTKSPNFIVVPDNDRGKLFTVFARFLTRSGPAGQAQPGPWSLPVTASAL